MANSFLNGREKRPILEVAAELGVELEAKNGGKYYVGFCPLHPNVNTPAFAIYPESGRWVCWSCSPDGGDVIDLVRRMQRGSLAEARDWATVGIPPFELAYRKAAELLATKRRRQVTPAQMLAAIAPLRRRYGKLAVLERAQKYLDAGL